VSKVIKIKEEYLNELIGLVSAKAVGKILKRFEVLPDINLIKKEVKELIYESFRDFRDLILAHNVGLDVTIFDFRTNKTKRDNLTQK
jgi:hypothetical protein